MKTNSLTHFFPLLILFGGLFHLFGCSESEPEQQQSEQKSREQGANLQAGTEGAPAENLEFATVEWTDLMPKEDLDILMDPPEYLSEIEDGTEQDQIGGQLKNNQTVSDDPYQQALVSTKVKPEMDGKAIRIPGFVVPIEFNDDQVITEFFLVPFFGACIHTPPPPPNQIILVNAPQGIELEVLYDPFWISGVLSTALNENDLAISAYAMRMVEFEAFDDTNNTM